MTFAWFLVIVTLMAGPSKGKKIKRAKSKKNIGKFTDQDYGLPESEISSIDWDALISEDDDEVEGTAIKKEQLMKSPSPTITYTRRRSARSSGVRFNESVLSPQWGHQESPRIGEIPAPTQPSTTHEGESSQPTSNLDSFHREHQRLMDEQAKLVKDFERVTTELRDVKKKQNSISRMVKKIYFLIGCSSSVDLDSD